MIEYEVYRGVSWAILCHSNAFGLGFYKTKIIFRNAPKT